MVPLIGLGLQALIANLVPAIGKHLFGESGKQVAEAVVDTVQTVFGTDKPDEIEKAIAKDPLLAMQLKIKLLEISDRESERKHQHVMGEFADLKSARDAYTATNGNTVPAISAFTLVMFFVTNCLVIYGAFLIFGGNMAIANIELAIAAATIIGNIQGSVNSKAEMVYGFFFGSSASARSNSTSMTAAMTDLVRKAGK
jgi:hypothetical protein